MPKVAIGFQREGNWEAFSASLDALLRLPAATLGVSVPATEHPPRYPGAETLPYLALAIINEHGADHLNIPARPLFGPTMRENEQKYADMVRKAIKTYLRRGGSDLQLRADLMGVAREMEQDVKDVIDTGDPSWPELHPRTVDRKGHDMPWFETGELRDAIEAVVHLVKRPQRTKKGVGVFRGPKGRFAKAT